MKKHAKTAKGSAAHHKIAGCLLEGSSVANIYKVLQDGKPHTLKAVQACMVAKTVSVRNRLKELGRKGVRTKQWTIKVDGDRVQMVLGKPSAGAKPLVDSGKKASSAPASRAASKATPKKKTTGRAKVQDVPAADED